MGRLAGQGPLFLQVCLVLVAGVAMVGISYFALTSVKSSSQRAGSHFQSAIEAAELSGIAHRLSEGLVLDEATSTSESSPVAAVAADETNTVLAVHLATQMLDEAEILAASLHVREGDLDTLALVGAVEQASGALTSYAEALQLNAAAGASESAVTLARSLRAFGLLADGMLPESHDSAAVEIGFTESVATLALVAIMAVVLAASIGLIVMTWVVGRRLRAALAQAGAEQEALAASALRIGRRNEQFEALYRVVTEFSETLSMTYVVATAVREARALVAADVTELRILRDDELEILGVSARSPEVADSLRAVTLGSGITGRVAKRGQSIHVDTEALATLVDAERLAGVQSGIVVPLIVGARIVGTLACWSCEAEAFAEDDVRILELMASQVASAIVSADAHETSQHDAHTDSLTSLPNRRQLSEDASQRFEALVAEGRLTVAMADIDHFKRFNDEFGHQTGDVTLQKIAEVLRLCMRDADGFYRYGGEEFVIVVQDMPKEACTALLERLREAVARTPLTGAELQPVGPVTLSIGLASGKAASFDELLGRADLAMYESKSAGRNCLTDWADVQQATVDDEAA